jgi:protein-tyrosine kinase
MSRIDDALAKTTGNSGGKDPEPVVVKTGNKNNRQKGKAVDHPLLVTCKRNFSPVSEEYKKLKARIMKMTKQDPFKNLLLVTSTIGSEGKSMTAANLAVSLAQDYDHSVLLIDGDTRKPTLHTFFNVKPEIGLTDCVADGVDVGAALIPIECGKLTFLPAGRKMHDPVELFGSSKMRKTLEEMKNRYHDRYVIIDSPPALLFAETKILGALVDGIIFVIREGKAPVEHLDEAFEILGSDRIMGVVYNDTAPDHLNGSYTYQRYYDHYHKS